MQRAQFIATAAGLVLAGAAGTPAAADSALRRSLWVWRTPLGEAERVAEFARRNRFDLIFLSLGAEERSSLEAGEKSLLTAVRALSRSGIAVYAVAGDPAWVKRSRTEAPESVRMLLAANNSYGLFTGLALDLEPHTLPEWKDESQKPMLAKNYLEVLALVGAAAGEQRVRLLATVHPTYAKYVPSRSGQTLLQSAANAVDATDLMTYRNSDSSLASFAGAAMEQLAGVGKPWWLGVSTHASAPPGTSYATLPAAQFFPSIDATAADLAKRYGGSFAGISVEDYRNTVDLLQQAG